MELRVLGSGSSGNGYLLVSNQDALLIECGVKFSEVKRTLDFDLSKLSGCVATHSHGDHFKYATQVIAAGVDLYCSEGTFKESGLNRNHRTHVIRDQDLFGVGSFKILPLFSSFISSLVKTSKCFGLAASLSNKTQTQ